MKNRMRSILTVLIAQLLCAALLGGCASPAAPSASAGNGAVVAAVNTRRSYTAKSNEEFIMSDDYQAFRKEMTDLRKAAEPYRDELSGFSQDVITQILASEQAENRVISPVNLFLATAMLAECADGDTQKEILSALHVSDTAQLRKAAEAVWNANYADAPTLTSLLADSMWLSDEIAYEPDTRKVLAEHYHASSYSGKMGSEEMNKALQDWTNENTKDLLKDYTKDLATDPRTVLALVSTIYFKTAWQDPFRAEETEKAVFHGASADAECDMMHESGMDQYYYGKGFSAIVKNFAEGGGMYFFLPDEGTSLADVVKNPECLAIVSDPWDYENSRTVIVNESIPKFTLSGKTDLTQPLKELGITKAFDADAADFGNLTKDTDAFVSQAEHAAVVAIDEEGMTGAAYTAYVMAGAGMPPEETVDFVLDRPFYFIAASADGTVLFAGTVSDIGA